MTTFVESEIARLKLDNAGHQEAIEQAQQQLNNPGLTGLRQASLRSRITTLQNSISQNDAQLATYEAKISGTATDGALDTNGNPAAGAGIDDPTIDQAENSKLEIEVSAVNGIQDPNADPEALDAIQQEAEDELADAETSKNTLADDEETNLNEDPAEQQENEDNTDNTGDQYKEEIDEPAVRSFKPVEVSKQKVPVFETTENPLLSYASSTYNIRLSALTPTDYNNIIKDPTTPIRPKVVIISAGRRSKDLPRSQHFYEDFYFDYLKFNTIVGMNARTRGTNTIDLNFKILEPYGFTLHNRMIKLAQETGAKSLLEQPYLLSIDFFGINDRGEPSMIENQTKHIPIKITGMKAKVSQRGGEYECTAIPYNHAAFQETNVSTPVNLNVTAGTVFEFFDPTEGTTIVSESDQRESAVNDAENEEVYDARDAQAKKGRVNNLKQTQVKQPYYVSSYAGAINDWFANLKKRGNAQTTTSIDFVIDEKIKDSKIVFPKVNNPRNTPLSNPADPKQATALARTAAGQKGAGNVPFDKENFPINAGTSVIEVINAVIRNSEFIRKQVIDPSDEKLDPQKLADKQNTPIEWFKVIPVIKLTEFDAKLNKWAKKITYYIKTYTVYNQKNPNAPKSQPNGWSKRYDYIYTGQNTKIIDFSLDFDMLFYTALTAERGKMEALNSAPEADESKLAGTIPTTSPNTGHPQPMHFVSGDQQASAIGNANRDSRTIAATDLVKSIYSSARGDMINAKLKIVGDPELIKQDDIFFNPSNQGYDDDDYQFTTNYSLKFDRGELFALITWVTPVDLDDSDGTIRFYDDDPITSTFSGVYKFITVENEFRQGVFTQSLDLIRQPNQPEFDVVGPARKKKVDVDGKATRSIGKAGTPLPGALPGFDPDFDPWGDLEDSQEDIDEENVDEESEFEEDEDNGDLDDTGTDDEETGDEEAAEDEGDIELEEESEDWEEVDISDWEEEESTDPEGSI
jgi:hypothetical protein